MLLSSRKFFCFKIKKIMDIGPPGAPREFNAMKEKADLREIETSAYGLAKFKEWLNKQGNICDYADISTTEFNDSLRKFYAEVKATKQNQNKNCTESSGDQMRLIYNRVPKCGSTTFQNLLVKLKVRNGFNLYSSILYDSRQLNDIEQMQLVKKIESMDAPLSFERHVFFTNFTKFNEKQPIYMNIIRDPVERIISSFYYNKPRIIELLKNQSVSSNVKKYRYLHLTFEECVEEQNEKDVCHYKYGEPSNEKLMVPFFCGHSNLCRLTGNEWALNVAKYNIENYYAVVGVLEDMDKTLQVLERYIPKFFSGISEIYRSKAKGNTEGKVLCELVKTVFKKFNLTLSDIVAECFDGATNNFQLGLCFSLADTMADLVQY
ncbi:Heparan sulfate 2-O-sulfotransferase 1 [Nymphon striatum]|nr:Heparan sulfate 2-O-sulfotransferase 1 [Nymphon striatum]